MAYQSTPFDSYITSGLEAAKGLLNQGYSAYQQYPSYVPSQASAPKEYDYYNYTPTTPMQQIQQPNYKGLMEGDYDKLQQSLTAPGQQAATDAYQQGLVNLQDTMGGRGLYGSSIMGNQQVQGLDKVYQNTLAQNAANAVAQRYGLQQQDLSDLNKFMAQNYATQVGENANIWKSNAAESANRGAYDSSNLAFKQSQDEMLRDWKNKQAYEKYTYDLAKNAYLNQIQENLFNKATALAGTGTPLTQMATNYNLAQQQAAAAQQAASQASSAANMNSWLGLAGGLLGTQGVQNYIGSMDPIASLGDIGSYIWDLF